MISDATRSVDENRRRTMSKDSESVDATLNRVLRYQAMMLISMRSSEEEKKLARTAFPAVNTIPLPLPYFLVLPSKSASLT